MTDHEPRGGIVVTDIELRCTACGRLSWCEVVREHRHCEHCPATCLSTLQRTGRYMSKVFVLPTGHTSGEYGRGTKRAAMRARVQDAMTLPPKDSDTEHLYSLVFPDGDGRGDGNQTCERWAS